MASTIPEELITALHKGDHKAFEKIFNLYYNNVKYFIFDLVKTEHDAENLAQDVFEKLWNSRNTLDPDKNLKTYIYITARNISLNFIHKRILRNQCVVDQKEMKEETVSTEEQIFAEELQLLLDMKVEELSGRRKEIYKLSINEGFSDEEISEKLKIDVRTVKNTLRTAISEVRRKIAGFVALVF